MQRVMKQIITILALVATAASVSAQTNLTRLLRQPDIHGDTVAFVYGGDIWLAPAKGGEARRLTSDPGMEYFPKFSPDGKWIAPAQGGEARRLTSDPGMEYFPKFSPDGKWIAFTGEYSGSRQVFVISADGENFGKYSM